MESVTTTKCDDDAVKVDDDDDAVCWPPPPHWIIAFTTPRVRKCVRQTRSAFYQTTITAIRAGHYVDIFG